MKKFKQAAALVAAASMVVAALAGCGSKDAETNAASDGTQAAASTEGAFKIGGIGPTTGGAAVYGQAVKNAIEMAAEEINAAGGIL